MIYVCIDNVDIFFLVLYVLSVFFCYFMYYILVLKFFDCRMEIEILKKIEIRFYYLLCDNMI